MAESRAERKAREAAEKLAASNPGPAPINPSSEEKPVENPETDQPPADQPDADQPPTDQPPVSGEPGQSRPVYDPLSNPLEYTPEEAAAIREGIVNGHIHTAPAAVTIRAKSSPTGKDESQPFTAYVPNDAVGCIILAGGKEEAQTEKPEEGDDTRTEEEAKLGMVDYFFHGYYLKRWNNTIRDMLMESIAGPEKEIAKRVKNLLEGKLAKSEVQARTRVIRMRVIEGLAVPEKDMVAFLEREKITADQLEAWRTEHADD